MLLLMTCPLPERMISKYIIPLSFRLLWIKLTSICSFVEDVSMLRIFIVGSRKRKRRFFSGKRMLRWPFEGQEMSNQIVFVTRLIAICVVMTIKLCRKNGRWKKGIKGYQLYHGFQRNFNYVTSECPFRPSSMAKRWLGGKWISAEKMELEKLFEGSREKKYTC